MTIHQIQNQCLETYFIYWNKPAQHAEVGSGHFVRWKNFLKTEGCEIAKQPARLHGFNVKYNNSNEPPKPEIKAKNLSRYVQSRVQMSKYLQAQI